MSLPRYPKYKDSGVAWLGEVPEHWEVKPLKYLVSLRSGGTPSKANLDYWDGDVPWASSKDLKPEALSDTEDHITKHAIDEGAAELVPAGSVLVVVRGMILLHTFPVVKAMVPMAINQDLKAISPRPVLDSDYLAWLLRGSSRETLSRLDEAGHGTKVLRIDAWTAMPLPVPPAGEQPAIAVFLDRETAKIDALVAEQQRLIELLKEKRQAVISHAVTKGLNPDVPMKDSGIEWLGQVPAHWRCVRNKTVFHEVDQRSESDSGELLTVSHITGVTRRADKEVNMFLAETLEGYKMCLAGDLVINTMWAWMGALGCSPLDGLVSPAYNVYRPRSRDELSPSYYDYLCRLPSHRVAMKARSSGVWESRLRLYPDAFLDMRMTLPPIGEQAAIARHLDGQTAKFDTLTAEAQRAIDLLQERRTALISAAVTGQIDVRSPSPRA